MKIRLLSIAHKPPAWIQTGYQTYAKRLPPSCTLELVEIPAEKHSSHLDTKRLIQREGEKLLSHIKAQHRIIALDVKGHLWSTIQLSEQLARWQQEGKNIDLLIGGAEGLAQVCLDKAEQTWSLSTLTFPHLLVRLIVAEQLYRAWSILHHHPYHR